MTERDFWIILERVKNTQGGDGEEFVEIVNGMINLLDSCDPDDIFGTEGWRRDFGWEH